jgi:hypothetical protein
MAAVRQKFHLARRSNLPSHLYAQFLNTRMGEETEERLLQFFDGRPPTWRLAQSAGASPSVA